MFSFRQYCHMAAIVAAVAVALPGANPAFAAYEAAAAKPKEILLHRWTDLSSAPEQVWHFPAFPMGAKAGSMAIGDLGDDGIQEVLVGSALGDAPLIHAMRMDGSDIFSIAAYDPGMMHGVSVAIGDLDGDGRGEIVTGTGPGAVAHVRLLDVTGRATILPGGFFPYGQDFHGGVNVAVADIDGDGSDEIITAPGPGAAPHIRIWNAHAVLLADVPAFDEDQTAGLNIAAADFDGDGRAEIAAALAGGSEAVVRVFFGFEGKRSAEFTAIGGGFDGGLNLAGGDLDGDGKAELIVAPAGGGGPHVHVFDGTGKLRGQFFPYEEAYRGGVLLAVGKMSDGTAVLATAPADRGPIMRPELAKFIYVDISEQRLRAYEYGRLARTFLVATGMYKYPTPLGEYSILDKPYKVNYRWTYGPGNPDNFDLGWVTWNLRIMPHKYIHYAPWRKVFGIRGSHGCVNVSKADAQWIYGWADLGTPVSIQQ